MPRSVLEYIRRHLVALLALFFALAGSSYATTSRLLPPNSVGTRQVIDHSLLSRDFKKGQLPRGPKGPQGAPGPPGASATKLWAVVGGTGKLARGSGVTSASRYSGQARYAVDFNQNVSNCAYIAAIGEPGKGSSAGNGQASAIADVSSANRVNISTYSGTGVPTYHAFNLAVFC
jgi:hypothetical protein